jgi:hypothetical protein
MWQSFFHLRSATREQAFSAPRVNGVYFPLLAVLLPRWNLICDQRSPNTKKVLYLCVRRAPLSACSPLMRTLTRCSPGVWCVQNQRCRYAVESVARLTR